MRGNFLGVCGARFFMGAFSGGGSLFTVGLPWCVARWRWCSFWRVGRRILACWRWLGLVGPKWRQLRIKVGGAGNVELDLDGWVGEGDDGGVKVVDESVLGDFLIEVGVQKR